MSALAVEGTERLFIGVPLAESTRLSLLKQIPPVIPGRATPPENWHFTLRFLGSSDAGKRDRLVDALEFRKFGSAFDIEFDTLGAFPNARRARVIWIGVGNGHTKLENLAKGAESAAQESGFEAEPRKFSAHLTISRIRHPESVTEFLAKPPKINAIMRVTTVALFRSEPGGQHSRYTVVAAFPLS